jgi:hypothetical protein
MKLGVDIDRASMRLTTREHPTVTLLLCLAARARGASDMSDVSDKSGIDFAAQNHCTGQQSLLTSKINAERNRNTCKSSCR